jgi:hypothetical protein
MVLNATFNNISVSYMPTLERRKAVGGGLRGFPPPPNKKISEGRKIVHSAAFWI